MKEYYVSIMTNRHHTLYIGMTSDLARRVNEHRHTLRPGVTRAYNNTQLDYHEVADDGHAAIARE
jgi:putative endonuclease